MFVKINAFKNFASFTGKQLRWETHALQALRPATLLK